MSADPIQQLRNTLFQIPSIPQLRQAQLVLAQRLQQGATGRVEPRKGTPLGGRRRAAPAWTVAKDRREG